MTTPDDGIPGWLRESAFQHSLDSDETLYYVADELSELLCEPFCMSNGEIEGREDLRLREFTEWRSRVATTLGLVEPPSMLGRYAVAKEVVDRAIAAELRRLADERLENAPPFQVPDEGRILETIAEWLRARAAELDPPTGSSR